MNGGYVLVDDFKNVVFTGDTETFTIKGIYQKLLNILKTGKPVFISCKSMNGFVTNSVRVELFQDGDELYIETVCRDYDDIRIIVLDDDSCNVEN